MPRDWFPGHMARGERYIRQNLKYVDLVYEMADARIPRTSRNPRADRLLGTAKGRILVLNKADLADPRLTKEWVGYFSSRGLMSVALSTHDEGQMKELLSLSRAVKERVRPGRSGLRRKLRAMVVGIPNVGKSSFINRVAGRVKTPTGRKPGVTRGKLWVKVDQDLELLDLPGVLWPNLRQPETLFRLAVTGVLSEEAYDREEVAMRLMDWLVRHQPSCLEERYGIAVAGHGLDLLRAIGKERGCIRAGGEVDLAAAAGIVLREFRAGQLGRHTLEEPESADG